MSTSGDRSEVVSAAVIAGRVADRLEAEQRDASLIRKAIEQDTAELGFTYSATHRSIMAALLLGTAAPIPIGQYDPAVTLWRFYPEYLTPQEARIQSQTSSSHYASIRQVQELYSDAGNPVIDLFDPLTHHIRQITAPLQGSLFSIQEPAWTPQALLTRAADKTPNISVGPFDSAVICYLALSHRRSLKPADDFAEIPDQFLDVVYQGIQVQSTYGTERGTHRIAIAARSPDNQNIWEPDLDVITVAAWRQLKGIPLRLLDLREGHPQFSTEACAMTYNFRR